MARRKKKYDDDDGRVVAPMNVEGMPWYTPGHTTSLSDNERDGDDKGEERANSPSDLTPKETFWVYVGAMKAGCLVSLIASAVIAVAGLIAWIVLGGLAK